MEEKEKLLLKMTQCGGTGAGVESFHPIAGVYL
jgi:hypothetical protein